MKIDDLPLHKDTYFFGYGIDIEKPIEMANQIIKLQQENQELKKQLSNSHQIKKQKEFIEYLEDEIKRLEENNIYQPLQRMALETYKHNLLKYKEIIGGKEETEKIIKETTDEFIKDLLNKGK